MERCTGTNCSFLYVYRVCPYDSSQVKYRRGGILHCSTNNSVDSYDVRIISNYFILLLDGSKAVACLVLSLGIIEDISVLNWIAVGDYFARAIFGAISGIKTILYSNTTIFSIKSCTTRYSTNSCCNISIFCCYTFSSKNCTTC